VLLELCNPDATLLDVFGPDQNYFARGKSQTKTKGKVVRLSDYSFGRFVHLNLKQALLKLVGLLDWLARLLENLKESRRLSLQHKKAERKLSRLDQFALLGSTPHPPTNFVGILLDGVRNELNGMIYFFAEVVEILTVTIFANRAR